MFFGVVWIFQKNNVFLDFFRFLVLNNFENPKKRNVFFGFSGFC